MFIYVHNLHNLLATPILSDSEIKMTSLNQDLCVLPCLLMHVYSNYAQIILILTDMTSVPFHSLDGSSL